jgi:uncharacterized protein with ParB-like and HNH nuclease domain
MSNAIKLYSISELLEMNFYIPSYQRGFRWTKQQVEDLLNDIYGFATKKNKSEKEFYCLQPIVVKKHIWEKVHDNKDIFKKEGWELVDGQQRLTTIRILLSYFIKTHLIGKSFKERYNKDVFSIEYETRSNSEYFLNNITGGNNENIDFYHISEAFTTISNWFSNKVIQEKIMLDDICDSILRTLVYNQTNKKSEGVVQVIWYELNENENPIDSFIRINLGKISLTNSELIKALFLQERFFGNNKFDNENELAKLRQLEIANDWDRIENSLQNEDFWWFLNKSENLVSSRIEFVFNLITSVAKNQDDNLEETIGTDYYDTFRYFYQKFDKHDDFDTLKKEWDIVKEYYLTFEDWYNNPVWYHYIGFLVYSGESIFDIFGYTKRDSETQNEIKTKQEITSSLIKRISKSFEHISWKIDEEMNPFLDLSFSNKEEKQKIKDLLLLFNLQHIVKQSENNILIYKFPFKSFKEIKNINGVKTSWDVEHIDSFTKNPLKDRNTQVEWISNALEDVGDKLSEDLLIYSKEFISNNGNNLDFFKLQNEISIAVGEGDNDDKSKNNIGNLTLLDAGTNRGYGNALFPTKRRKIIEKETAGVFIPICTKNAFLKYFDAKGSTGKVNWTISDIKKYRTEIADTLIDFLPHKPQKNNNK